MIDASDANRWVGVGIALVGCLVVAPAGTGLLWHTAAGWTHQRGHQLRGRLARVLPFLRRDATIRPNTVSAVAAVATATVTVSGRVWTPSAPVDERIEALRQHIAEVEGRLNEITSKLNAEREARERAVAELKQTLKEETAALCRQLEERERDSARIDARGLPVIGLGVLLSGVPDELASLPIGLGWLFPVVGLGAVVAAVQGAWRARHGV
jgi:hypothetical protein